MDGIVPIITGALTDLSDNLLLVAPVAVGVSLAAFGLTWLLRKGKAVAK